MNALKSLKVSVVFLGALFILPCPNCFSADAKLPTFDEMTSRCLSIITNRTSSEPDLVEAISRLGQMSEPPSFWTAIIKDSSYTMLHRKRCVMALFRRHGSYKAHAADLAAVLDAPGWLDSRDISQVSVITGSVPVEVNGDETIFLIQVLNRREFESGSEQRTKPFGIYVRVSGKITLEEFSSVVRTGRPSVGDGEFIIRQYGYGDDYDKWLRWPQNRPKIPGLEFPW